MLYKEMFYYVMDMIKAGSNNKMNGDNEYEMPLNDKSTISLHAYIGNPLQDGDENDLFINIRTNDEHGVYHELSFSMQYEDEVCMVIQINDEDMYCSIRNHSYVGGSHNGIRLENVHCEECNELKLLNILCEKMQEVLLLFSQSLSKFLEPDNDETAMNRLAYQILAAMHFIPSMMYHRFSNGVIVK